MTLANPRGRILYVDDIQTVLGIRKSPWWIKRHFAPEVRFKIGRDWAWYEEDAIAWLQKGRGVA